MLTRKPSASAAAGAAYPAGKERAAAIAAAPGCGLRAPRAARTALGRAGPGRAVRGWARGGERLGRPAAAPAATGAAGPCVSEQ